MPVVTLKSPPAGMPQRVEVIDEPKVGGEGLAPNVRTALSRTGNFRPIYRAAAGFQPVGETGAVGCFPTEAQWEKAARGTDGRILPLGLSRLPDLT